MRFGVSISGKRPGSEALELAKIAEGLGCDEIWVTEDYCERGAFALAGAIGAVTRSAGIGIGTINPWTRHPMLIAMEAGALAEISGSRAILGLGASNAVWMDDQLGITFSRPLERLKESVGVVRAALDGRKVRHTGDAFRIDAEMAFQPGGRVPIFLGVKGPRALAMAREIADGVVLPVLSSPAYVEWARHQVGRDMPLSSYVIFSCDTDGQAARDALRHTVANFLGLHGANHVTRVAGLAPELAARFRDGWLEGRPRVDLITDQILDTFTVSGDPDQCSQSLRHFAEAGLQILLVRDSPLLDMTETIRHAKRLTESAV